MSTWKSGSFWGFRLAIVTATGASSAMPKGLALRNAAYAVASLRLRRSARVAASREEGKAVVRTRCTEVGRLRVVMYRTWR
jgi:hypothetical protein